MIKKYLLVSAFDGSTIIQFVTYNTKETKNRLEELFDSATYEEVTWVQTLPRRIKAWMTK